MYVHAYVQEYVSKYYPFYEKDWKAVSGCNATRNCAGSMRLQATVVKPPSLLKYKAPKPGPTKINAFIGRDSDITLRHGPLAWAGHASSDVRSQGFDAGEKTKKEVKADAQTDSQEKTIKYNLPGSGMAGGKKDDSQMTIA